MLRWLRVAPLGNPVVPDVYWMLIASVLLEAGLDLRQALGADPLGAGERSRQLSVPMRTTCSRPGDVAADLLDHRGVVAGLERRRGHDHPDAGLAQHVPQLVRPVGGVDVDEDRADLRRGELDDDPLGAVRRPDADPVALLDARRRAGRGPPRRRPAAARPRSTAGPARRRRAPRGPGTASAVASRLSPMVCSISGTSVSPAVYDRAASAGIGDLRGFGPWPARLDGGSTVASGCSPWTPTDDRSGFGSTRGAASRTAPTAAGARSATSRLCGGRPSGDIRCAAPPVYRGHPRPPGAVGRDHAGRGPAGRRYRHRVRPPGSRPRGPAVRPRRRAVRRLRGGASAGPGPRSRSVGVPSVARPTPRPPTSAGRAACSPSPSRSARYAWGRSTSTSRGRGVCPPTSWSRPWPSPTSRWTSSSRGRLGGLRRHRRLRDRRPPPRGVPGAGDGRGRPGGRPHDGDGAAARTRLHRRSTTRRRRARGARRSTSARTVARVR